MLQCGQESEQDSNESHCVTEMNKTIMMQCGQEQEHDSYECHCVTAMNKTIMMQCHTRTRTRLKRMPIENMRIVVSLFVSVEESTNCVNLVFLCGHPTLSIRRCYGF